MPTVNETIRDAEIGHQINLSRYSNGVVMKMIALLNRTDSDLFAALAAALDRAEGAQNFSVDRLNSLLQSVRSINAAAYQQVGRALTADMRSLVDYEAGFQSQLFGSELPRLVSVASVGVDQVYGAAMSRPFQGRLLSEWAQSLESDRMTRVRDAVRIGFVENQTNPEIVKRIRGTRANGYADGLLEIDRRSAESVARTAVSHTAGFTRDKFYEANNDLIKAVVWTSTLDSRTSEICMLRDGLEYENGTYKPLGHSYPWLGGPGRAHWNCRSSSVPVVKSFRELGLDIGEFSPSTRASMDGQVAAETTYGEWLKKQSASRQDEVLGATRGKLLRDGGYTVDKFANDKGRWYSVEELRAMDARAFKRAGI
jgi:hypothetical protein